MPGGAVSAAYAPGGIAGDAERKAPHAAGEEVPAEAGRQGEQPRCETRGQGGWHDHRLAAEVIHQDPGWVGQHEGAQADQAEPEADLVRREIESVFDHHRDDVEHRAGARHGGGEADQRDEQEAAAGGQQTDLLAETRQGGNAGATRWRRTARVSGTRSQATTATSEPSAA